MSNFNVDQQKALDVSVNKDLLISAGAGSGKTTVLSAKVKKIIENCDEFEHIDPSRLLVLTFTNNSAFDMKNKIIAKFKDNRELALKLTSAHIQTFDSFNMYLASTYSGVLGIPERIGLANADVLKTKKSVYLDEVFEEYYADKEKSKRLVKTLKKFNMRDDGVSKKVIADIIDRLLKMSSYDRADFISNYDKKYLSKEFFDDVIHQLVVQAKKKIEDELCYCYFLSAHQEELKDDVSTIFDNVNNFIFDVNNLPFMVDEVIYPFYLKVKELLNLNDVDFINRVKSFKEDNAEILSKFSGTGSAKYKSVCKGVLDLLINSNGGLDFIYQLNDLDDEYRKIISFRDDINLYLDIAVEVLNKISDYKRVTNTYEFGDIADMVITLLTDERFNDIAEEIRNRFDFIMVDEYQDTSNIQEILINSLTAPKKDGSRSHLFCVGDVKQCIYAFRSSNVQLFRNRQNAYETDPDSEAISMNINYRSGKRLLMDINHIFNFYMTMNHGGISYNQIKESLCYDDKKNPYNMPYDNFGIYRIVSKSTINNDDYPYGSERWEIKAIAKDILDKVSNGYVLSAIVEDSNGQYVNVEKKCTYSDFCILVRKRTNIKVFQEIFQEYDIPLNCTFKNSINEVKAVTVLQSLVGLINYRINNIPLDGVATHLYASIARSYLFEVSDQNIFDDLYLVDKDYTRLEKTYIFIKIDDFVSRHLDSPLSKILVDLIDEFGIIKELYKIGSVDDSISKIESLYLLALAQEMNGEGIKEFVELMNNVSKYDLDLESETLYQVDDAVDLMTIHGSKGLQRKIVYMPCATNSIGGEDFRNKPDYTFSKKLGIILPDYSYQVPNDIFANLEEGHYTNNVLNLLNNLLDEKTTEEINEHVRLFYVALTRAENTLYIVGDLPKLNDTTIASQKQKNSLYGMLCFAPHYIKIKEDYLTQLITNNAIKQELYDNYVKAVRFMKGLNHKITPNQLNEEDYRRYSYLWEKHYSSAGDTKLNNAIIALEKDIYYYYHPKIALINDYNDLSRLYGLYIYKDNKIRNLNDLINYRPNDEEEDSKSINGIVITKDNVKEVLDRFKNALLTGQDPKVLGLSDAKSVKYVEKQYGNVPVGFGPKLVPALASYFDNVSNYKVISFETDDYEDRTYTYDYLSDNSIIKTNKSIPTFEHNIEVNDNPLEFSTRVSYRASKKTSTDELPPEEILTKGIELHRLLELVDFKTKDTSFIKNKEYKDKIDYILNNIFIFKDLSNATIYQEYGYYDEDLSTTGFIDLMIEKDGHYYIIDYKTNNISSEEYERQLEIYQHNIMRLFNVTDNKKIHLYLLSIEQGRIRKLEDLYD